MSLLRSEDMQLYTVAIPGHNAYRILRRFAHSETVHIVGRGEQQQQVRPFHAQLKVIEEAISKVHILEEAILSKGLVLSASEDYLKQLLEVDDYDPKTAIATLQTQYQYYVSLAKNVEGIRFKLESSQEVAAMVKALTIVFPGGSLRADNEAGLVTVIGVCQSLDEDRLSKALFRASRGNSLVKYFRISELLPNSLLVSKSIITIFVRGDQFISRTKRLLDAYGVKQLRPSDQDGKQFDFAYLQGQIEDASKLLKISQKELGDFLEKLVRLKAGVSEIVGLKLQLLRQRKLFQAFSGFKEQSGFFIGLVWIPKSRVSKVFQIVQEMNVATQGEGCYIKALTDHSLKPPTYFPSNEFLLIPQLIVETYGVPRYKEASPALFTSVTFPFLFGVMFGDIGHGFILMVLGLVMILAVDYVKDSMLRALLPARYFIALMGFFAFFCGLIYNDFLSMTFGLFNSCQGAKDCVYPFGLDPTWGRAENNLAFVNSLKMKLSVILGVLQMSLGIFIKAANAVHSGSTLDFYFEFVPQIIFMTTLFVYMDFLIVLKWLSPWHNTAVAPSIITTMINLPLKLGKTGNSSGAFPMWGEYGNTSQDAIQLILLVVALLSVPLMLCPKPYLLTRRPNADQEPHSPLAEPLQRSDGSERALEEKGHADAHQGSQIWVHQIIETIEFVLGCVSNTASYLRLWALSLAHSQLSEVFFEKSLANGLESSNWAVGGIVLVLAYPVYSGVSFGVLMCMDCMECFLHTLRLHWVQFQSKFYKGDGIKYEPISVRSCLAQISRD